MKILIVEDELELAVDISNYLLEQSYLCEFASTYEQAAEKIAMYQYDCILLDLTLPGGNGIKLLERLKEINRQDGIIIISAKDSIDDKVLGLKLGADDYLSKPFNHSELAARIFSVIRRKQFDNSTVFKHNELSINLLSKTVFIGERELALTKKEYDLLLFFIGNKNKVITKSALAEHLSGDIAEMFDNHNFIYAHVKNLKKKIHECGGTNYLKTIYGTGYKWEVTTEKTN
jgi:DNA-binding response OmpR family regulator